MTHNQIKRILKEYFTFTRGERTGIFILLSVLFAVICFNVFLKNLSFSEKKDFTKVKEAIQKWEQKSENFSGNGKYLFQFDPNTIEPKVLDSLDFPAKVKRNMLKYRESGGSYRSVDDLRKIYGMNDSLFGIIREYVFISFQGKSKKDFKEQNQKNQQKENIKEFERIEEKISKNNPSAERLSRMELNSSDSISLVSINGLGPVLASRIIKYRNLLGGFYSISQLSEVYGLSPENYQKIHVLFDADTTRIKKIRLNFSGYKEMRHPYLNNYQVNSILRYRTNNGPFRSLDDLLKYNLVDSVTYKKVFLYLTTD